MFATQFTQGTKIVNFTMVMHFLQEYFEKWGHQGIVDLKQELNQLLMLISGRCLLGNQVREKMLDEFFTLFQELTDNGMCLTSIFFPYVPTPATRRRDIARAKLSEMLTEIVRSRKEYSHVENDVLQNFIDFKYSDGRSTTESEVIGLMITLILAGKHTSTITSIWTGAHLLASARILKSVLVEQKILISKYGDHLDYNAFLEMDTLHNCIKETLRIHPPVAIFRRKVHKNFIVQTKDGIEYEIHSGHTLVSPVIFNNNLPHIYKDPDVYDPDRFGPGREEDRVGGKFAYTSFSGGRHACKGESFAYLQIKVIWSYLLRNFELKLESPFPDPDWTKLVAEPKGRVMVSYKKRLLATTEVVHA